jgi:hypothetical protein
MGTLTFIEWVFGYLRTTKNATESRCSFGMISKVRRPAVAGGVIPFVFIIAGGRLQINDLMTVGGRLPNSAWFLWFATERERKQTDAPALAATVVMVRINLLRRIGPSRRTAGTKAYCSN